VLAGGNSRGGPARLDPSEEITPEELATIPEPVPSETAIRQGSETEPQGASAAPGSGTVSNPSWSDSVAPAPSGGVWRVQIHASENRAEAERVGRTAAGRLGVEFVIQREGSLYKVRLGGFASEAEARTLRDRAVRAGYPGAFRTLAAP
jgi:cell division septation protein DedD